MQPAACQPETEAKMIRLALVIYTLAATTLAGVGVVAVLSAGYGTALPIITAAVAGAALAVPVSIQVARALIRG
jgi:hypothetical protein